jgi:putative PEP-CTERM system TPR-repeat lipoprotein
MSSAKSALAKKDLGTAVVHLKAVLKDQPNSAPARFLLGTVLLEQGAAAAATIELSKSIELGHPEAQALPPLAEAMLAQEQYKKLIDAYASRELGDRQANASLHSVVARAFMALGDRRSAEQQVDQAIESDPKHLRALNLRTRLIASKGEGAKALAMNAEILAANPQDAETWRLRGELLNAINRDAAGAREAWRKSLSLEPTQAYVHQALVILLTNERDLAGAKAQLAEMRKALPDHPLTHLMMGQLALYEKDYRKTREIVQRLLKLAPENTSVLQLAAALELQAGSLRQAETHLAKLINLAPDYVYARQMMAQTHLRGGQPSKAVATLKPALEVSNPQAQTLSMAAMAYLQLGDAQRAEDLFARATVADPENTRSRIALALVRIDRGNPQMGFGELERIASEETDHQADMAVISAHLRRQDYHAAMRAIDRLEKKQAGAPYAAQMRGRVLMALKRLPEARRSFERALEIDSQFVPAAISLASLDLADKQPDAARNRLESMLAANPKNEGARLALIEFYAQTRTKPETMVKLIGAALAADASLIKPRVLLVNHYLQADNARQALSVAQEGTAALPESPEMLDSLGQAQSRLGDVQQAVATYNKLAALQPNSPLPHLRLAVVFANAKEPEGAVRSLNRALAISPNLVVAQRALVSQLLGAGKQTDALSVARNMQRQRPKQAAGYIVESEIESSRKAWSAAAAALRTGLKAVPDPELAVRLVKVLVQDGKPAEAEAFARTWRAQHPRDAVFILGMAETRLSQRKLDEAERLYREVLNLRPNSPMALNNLAWILSVRGSKEALPLAEKAAELMPDQAHVLDTLSMALAVGNQLPRAIEVQKRAVQLAPDDNLKRLRLAKLYLEAGEKALANQELRRLELVGDNGAMQAEVRELLKRT